MDASLFFFTIPFPPGRPERAFSQAASSARGGAGPRGLCAVCLALSVSGHRPGLSPSHTWSSRSWVASGSSPLLVRKGVEAPGRAASGPRGRWSKGAWCPRTCVVWLWGDISGGTQLPPPGRHLGKAESKGKRPLYVNCGALALLARGVCFEREGCVLIHFCVD